MDFRNALKLAFCLLLLAALPASRLAAQDLTLEGQTGGFLTPTAYIVDMEKGKAFSHPAVGFHFIDASAVIGNIKPSASPRAFATGQRPATPAVCISLETSPPRRPRRSVSATCGTTPA